MRAARDTAVQSTAAQDRARFLRTTVTCIWGVSDPLQGGRDHDRGWQRGSLTPQNSPHRCRQRADCDGDGTNRILCTAPKSLTRKDIDQSIGSQPPSRRRAFRPRAARTGGGPQVRSLWSPSLVAARIGSGATRGWIERPARASELSADLLTERAEPYRERPLIWSEPGL